jgi:hypothetical protein
VDSLGVGGNEVDSWCWETMVMKSGEVVMVVSGGACSSDGSKVVGG